MVSKPLLGVRACEIYGRKWVLGQVCSRDASLNRACWERASQNSPWAGVCVEPATSACRGWAMETHPGPCYFIGIVRWLEKPGHLS